MLIPLKLQFGFQCLYCVFSGLVVVHFAANWAPQCKQMAEVIGELAKDNVHVKFVQVCALLLIFQRKSSGAC